MRAIIDMSGQRFGAWVVVRESGRDKHGQALWECRCGCGAKRTIPGGRLRKGESGSCGCAKPTACAAASTRHGHAARGRLSPEYRTWSNMIDRCERAANRQYADYGGRGVTVCERWRADFANFFADMGLRPSLSHTIERIDNSRGYEQGNCRWATRTEQNRNKRSNLWTVVDGERMLLIDASRRLGVRYATARCRFVAAGSPTGEAKAILLGALAELAE